MAVKKTQLYASLWASCDKLRGMSFPGTGKANLQTPSTPM